MRLDLHGEPRLSQEMEGRSILVVDDESIIRDLCSKVLKGYRVLEAADGEEALRVLQNGQVDAILTDVMMPQMNGIELLKQIKEREPTQVVVVMTGYADKEVILKALKADADDFITKPINLLQLRTTLDKVLEKKALKEELVNLRRMDRLKTEFLGLISHKLKTPATGISLFIQNLAQGIGDPQDPGFQRTLEMILAEASYLEHLIQDLLSFSDIILQEGPPDLQPGDLRELAREVAADLGPLAAGKSAKIHSRLPQEFPTLAFDHKRIALTLRALLENALKFGPVGVEVTLDAEILPDRVMLTVSDNGPGIPRDELPKVFEKFYQIDPAQSGQIRGFGLGLFYARRFALDHGGSLQLDSEPGRGTSATLTLPR